MTRDYYAKRVREWRNREINPVRICHPDPILLQIGYLNNGFVPVESLDLQIRNAPFSEPKSAARLHLDDDFVRDAWQYGPGSGFGELLDFVTEVTREIHTPAASDWATVLDCGTTDGLSKIFHAFIDRGDCVLCEEFTYTPVLSSLACVGGMTVPVPMDASGIDPDDLRHLLANWTTLRPGYRFPKMLYTIPSGQNPTGVTQSFYRRAEVYDVCREFDLLIVEDDPYCYLVLEDFETVDEYKQKVPKSYLALDTDGRVLRCESFSKIFSPGIRLGYIVGTREFIETLKLYSNAINGPPSGVSQMVLRSTLEAWGWAPGYYEWLMQISREYRRRLDCAIAFLEKSKLFQMGKIKFSRPSNGMFLKIDIAVPLDSISGINDSMDSLQHTCHENGVGIILGRDMVASEQTSLVAFIRIGVSAVDDAEVLCRGLERTLRSIEVLGTGKG
ncbi:unnamed protein product [Kuraishia capsulata CBS 1993]|uniref:Aminotransferase class I/classII large domain-containing protein n=1 Tax=Kuraishia capsulata CBS 1993 TaxID=1382522 RepID=W6MWL1_9ASCO|nr:uncharacterized protein KUCA_T00003578001 [Kuraishia capsulata CBS 1993]CDK27600.1 unnamed protein product [Kuraishia capsulata CBS 1993]